MTPLVEASSGEKRLRMSSSLNERMKLTMTATPAMPRRKPVKSRGAKPPKRASIRSSVGVRRAPIATEATKMTPIAVSVESVEDF